MASTWAFAEPHEVIRAMIEQLWQQTPNSNRQRPPPQFRVINEPHRGTVIDERTEMLYAIVDGRGTTYNEGLARLRQRVEQMLRDREPLPVIDPVAAAAHKWQPREDALVLGRADWMEKLAQLPGYMNREQAERRMWVLQGRDPEEMERARARMDAELARPCPRPRPDPFAYDMAAAEEARRRSGRCLLM